MPIQDSTGTGYVPKIVWPDGSVQTCSWTHVREMATTTIYESGSGGTLIEGFESFPSGWEGRVNTIDGEFTTSNMSGESGSPIEGSVAALAPGGGFREAHSEPGDGLGSGSYLGIGSHHRVYHYCPDWSQGDWDWGFLYDTRGGSIDALRIRFWGENDRLYLYQVRNGSASILDRQYDAGLPDATWLESDIYVDDAGGDVYGLGSHGIRAIINTYDPSSGHRTQQTVLEGSTNADVGEGSGWEMRADGNADVYIDNLLQIN